MDIRHLRTFVTVARLGSVTRAAEALHITQPAVSGQLKNLEEALAVSLLSRTTASVRLTADGEVLLAKAERAIEAFGDFVHSAKALRGQLAGRLRMGVPMIDPGVMNVAALMQGMVARHPGLRIDLQVGRISWLLGAVRSAELDASLFVCKALPQDMGGLLLRPLTYRVVAPVAWHERLQAGGWPEAERLPWIRMTPHSAHHQLMTELLDRAGIRPRETAEADHEALIAALVAAGVGIGIVREEFARQGEAAGQWTLFTDASVHTALAFLHTREREGDPAMRALSEALRALWIAPTGEAAG
jgi:DNA-binding transcriptional LysR family regulator